MNWKAPRMTNVKGTETTTSTTVKILTPLMKVKCQENMVDLKYVVNNIDNVQDLDANNPSELVNFPPKGQAHHLFSRFLNLRLFFFTKSFLFCFLTRYKFVIEIENFVAKIRSS